MMGRALPRWLRRVVPFLGVPVVAASAVVALTGAPAQAAYINEGTFLLQTAAGYCLQVNGAATANGTLVVPGTCNASTQAQRWTIYQETDHNDYELVAFSGQYPLNKCLDAPNSNVNVTIYSCGGQGEQRFTLSPTTTTPQSVEKTGTGECLGITRFGDSFAIQQVNCDFALGKPLITLLRQ